MSVYSGPAAADLDHLPADLKDRPQWVLWRGADRVDPDTGEVTGLNKIPINPQTLHKADTTDPQTWGTFEQCVTALPVALEEWEHEDAGAYRGGGVGYVFTSEDPYTGVDLDHCRDPGTGMIELWAQTAIDQLNSYTQVSVSTTGLHSIVEATLPYGRRQLGNYQMWDHSRFFAMTGWHLPGAPTTIEPRQTQLTALWCTLFAPKLGEPVWTKDHSGTLTNAAPWPIVAIDAASSGELYARFAESPTGWPLVDCELARPSVQGGAASTLDDTALLDKARQAKNGPKFTALWAGDWSGYASQSEADEALCCLLVFWTQGDPARVDSLFRQSGLYPTIDRHANPEDYLQRTITGAMATVTAFYTPAAYLQVSRNGTSEPDENEQEHPPLDASIYGPAKPKTRDPDALPYSDYTNALALVREHGQTLRYCYLWKKWLVWTGTYWQHDTSGVVMRDAKQTIKRLARHADTLEDDAAFKALLKHVKTSLATLKLKAMVESAQSEPGIPVQPEDLDAHGWLLNCANGTLNLQTGQLQPHLQADLLTKCLPTAYDPAALCPTWERFLWRIMGGTVTPDDPNMSMGELDARHAADDRATRLTTFLQRAIGYSLTGSTSEQCLFVFHGSGANGKSTLLELLQALLGDYAQSTPSASLLAKERYDGIPNDIARLRGARLVTAVEIGEGKRLNEELVKRLTGQDTLTARFLHAEFFDFTAEFKLYLACNHLPQIRGTDHAIWRRVKLIPFTVTIPDKEQDKDLPAKLRAELPGILAWAVQGCLAWQQDGLSTPDEVTAATKDYRASQDVIGRFLEECCLVSPQVQVKAGDLYDAFKHWCEASGEYAVTKKAFGTSLDDRGFVTHASNGVWRRGIGLL